MKANAAKALIMGTINEQSNKTYVTFGNDDIDDAADDRDEIEHVPRITEVVLFQQTTTHRPWSVITQTVNALECKGHYSARSKNMKLVYWTLMGGLLHLVQRGGDWAWPQPARPLLAVPNITAHPSAPSVPITVLLYSGLLLCGFNVLNVKVWAVAYLLQSWLATNTALQSRKWQLIGMIGAACIHTISSVSCTRLSPLISQ